MPDEDLTDLFDYIEAGFVAVILSYQALEAFANDVIRNKLEGTWSHKRRGQSFDLTAEEVQRQMTTKEKLSNVLPKIFDVPKPTALSVWQRDYRDLQTMRDNTIHLKAQHVQPRELDARSIVHEYLDADLLTFPRTAAELMTYYHRGEGIPDWLTALRVRLGLS